MSALYIVVSVAGGVLMGAAIGALVVLYLVERLFGGGWR